MAHEGVNDDPRADEYVHTDQRVVDQDRTTACKAPQPPMGKEVSEGEPTEENRDKRKEEDGEEDLPLESFESRLMESPSYNIGPEGDRAEEEPSSRDGPSAEPAPRRGVSKQDEVDSKKEDRREEEIGCGADDL